MSLPAPSPWRWLGTLFFAEGLPATTVFALSAILFKRLGLPNEQIAFYTSALLLPWTVRPLWSPLIELVRTKRFFVIVTEATIAVSFVSLAGALATPIRVPACLILLGVVAVLAATHDMAADGLYISLVPPSMQTRSVAWLTVAFTVARLTAQGLVVILAGALEPRVGVIEAWRVVFFVLGGLMGMIACYHAWSLPTMESGRKDGPQRATAAQVLTSFLKRPNVLVFAALVVLYRFSEGQLGRIVPLFILDPVTRGGLGLSTVELGAYYGTLGGGAPILGALLAGRLAHRFGVRRVLLWLCAAGGVPTLLYVALAWYQPRALAIVGTAIIVEQVAYGVASIGLKLVMMQQLAAGRYAAAHFAFATALVSLGMTAGGMVSGVAQTRWGYRGFFVWATFAAIPAMMAAAIARRRIVDVSADDSVSQ